MSSTDATPGAVRPSFSVLVIEDNVHMRELLELRFARSDRLTLDGSFDNAEDALLALHDEGPDVVLCDIGLPGMSGLLAVPRFREACPEALIVIYTASPAAAHDAIWRGADAVIGKSTLPSRLVDMVLDLADQRARTGQTSAAAARGRWPAAHLGWGFDDQPEFERVITSFLADGATLGERLLLVTDDPGSHRWADGLVDDGSLVVVSTDEVYGEDRIVDAATQRATFHSTFQEAVQLGYSGLRVAADNTSLVLGPERLAAWLSWEAEAEALMQVNAITGLCAFDRSRLDEATLETLLDVHAAHPGPHVVG